jgi:hypothetical protein
MGAEAETGARCAAPCLSSGFENRAASLSAVTFPQRLGILN